MSLPDPDETHPIVGVLERIGARRFLPVAEIRAEAVNPAEADRLLVELDDPNRVRFVRHEGELSVILETEPDWSPTSDRLIEDLNFLGEVWGELTATYLRNGDGSTPAMRSDAIDLARTIRDTVGRLRLGDRAEPHHVDLLRKVEDAISRELGGVKACQVTGKQRAPFTDLGNAERFSEDHEGDLLSVPGLGWLYWDARRFRKDDDGEAMRRGKVTVRRIQEEARALPDEGEDGGDRKKAIKHGLRSEAEPRIKAAVNLASTDPALVAAVADLDRDPDAFNVVNGVVDLKSGELRPHSRAYRLTKLAPIEFDPDADCPR